ncbi:MAG: histidine phosphatase family protein [Syntrophales bacterium]|nr:histidine phosphatase family protein [Syntrophales bacterium]
MNLAIIRHGETKANRERVILGRLDSPITEAGMKETAKLAAALQYEGTGIILSSPLGRAVSTAEVFARASGWRITVMDGLTELACGQWEGRPRFSVLEEGRALRSTWTDAPPGGESCASAEARVVEAVRKIGQFSLDNILIVGHAGINQVFLKIWLSLEAKGALAIRQPHDLLYRIDTEGISWLNSVGETGEGLIIQR